MNVRMLQPPRRPSVLWPALCALFRRRLRPSRQPNPLMAKFTSDFFSGIGLGFVMAVAVTVIVSYGGR